MSEERLAPVNGIEIAYQEIGDPEGEPLLLIMGLATQMLAWDEEFCAMLAERGFRVVRFDNRDIGRSTKIESAGVPKRADMLLGRRSTAPYLLRDMADDTIGLMDHLEIESANLVGASMGGMIAQTVAIRHPERVRSLVSMMSSTGNRWLGVPTWKAFGTLFARPGAGRDAAIERSVRTFRTIGSPAYPMDEARFREMAAASYDRSHEPRRHRPPAARGHGLGRSHRGARKTAPAGDGRARRQRPPDPPPRRPRHRPRDPRLPPTHLQGHGPRPPPSSSGPTSSRRSAPPLSASARRTRPAWQRRPCARRRSKPPLPRDASAPSQPLPGYAPTSSWDAAERTRTSTGLPPRAPEARAYTKFRHSRRTLKSTWPRK